MHHPGTRPPAVRHEHERPPRPLRRLDALLPPRTRRAGLGPMRISVATVSRRPTEDARVGHAAHACTTPEPVRRRYDTSTKDPRDLSDGSMRSSRPLHDAQASAQCESPSPPCLDDRRKMAARGALHEHRALAESVRQQHSTLVSRSHWSSIAQSRLVCQAGRLVMSLATTEARGSSCRRGAPSPKCR